MSLLDFFNMKYPSTDFHELNLDWCISAVLQLQKAFEDFSAGNKLIFADPLQHDLTKTYAKNTIVLNDDGDAYLSLDTVPKGVQLSYADYWLMVFNFEDYIEKANKNFTDNYFRDTTRAPHALYVGDWLVLDDVLYKVTVDIAADELFDINVNIVHFTVEQFLKDFITSVNQTLYNYSLTIQQYKNDIDASELAYRQQLAQDIIDTTAALQAQLDQAIAGVTVDSEVINARVGTHNEVYPTLGDALRSQISYLIKALGDATENFIYDVSMPGYIDTSGATVDITSVVSSTYYNHAVYDCEADTEILIVRATGGNGPRVCCFIDSTGNVLDVTPASPNAKVDLLVTAPAGTDKVILNAATAATCIIANKTLLRTRVRNLENTLTPIASDYPTLSAKVNTIDERSLENENNIINYNDGLEIFRNSLDNANALVIFAGNSWTAGQGATDTGLQQVEGMETVGRTDAFHKPDTSTSGKFVDIIAREMKKYYPMSLTDGFIAANNTASRDYVGTWTQTNEPNIPESDPNAQRVAITTNVGSYVTLKIGYNYLKIRQVRSSAAGKAKIYARPLCTTTTIITSAGQDAMWKPLSQIDGAKRLDPYDDIDYIDEYQVSTDYTQFIEIALPYGYNWEFKFEVVTKNPNSSTGIFALGCNRYYNNFLNAGRGNHTTADFLGIPVTAGAGQSGAAPYGDNTDHLAEIIALKPSLVVLEPMIINDWFHGLNRTYSGEFVEEMIQRLKYEAKCDIIALMPGPVVTDDTPWDYAGPDPLLTNNLHGLGTYLDYYIQTMYIMGKYQVRTVNTYKYFVDYFHDPDHHDWTSGANAGRIHVNQYGHDLIAKAFLESSKLAHDIYDLTP